MRNVLHVNTRLRSPEEGRRGLPAYVYSRSTPGGSSYAGVGYARIYRMSQEMMHPKYLPFTKDQLRCRFVSAPEKHLAYYVRSIENWEKWRGSQEHGLYAA